MNKKKYRLFNYVLFCVLISFIANIKKVKADYAAKIINTSPCKLYYDLKGKNATGSCMYKDTTFKSLTGTTYWVDVGDNIKVITSKSAVTPPKSGYGSECKSSYVYMSIDYNNGTYYGYVCKDQIWNGTISNDLKSEFQKAGFPESYYNSLAVMKIAHPKWNFVAINTGLSFSQAVAGENYSGKSLIQVTGSYNNEGYLSTAEADYNYLTDKFIAHDGSSWYQARKEVIEYMMDPRNSLSDMYVFQFETLDYIENSNNLSAIKNMLNGHYILKYAEDFLKAGKSARVNAVYLASLSKQEIGGKSANTAITGASFTYNNKTYSGYYNFYNIGATSSSNPVINGLWYATGKGGVETTYNRPWNSEYKAILGGAQFIANRYIQYGQTTSYFKKWNVVKNYALANGYSKTNNLYTNQYMTNVEAPRSEAVSTYNSYKSLGTLDDEYTFYIPVYSNMPSSTSMPKKGNPNNYLNVINVSLNGGSSSKLTGFKSATTDYEFHVANNISKADIEATTINSNAKIQGVGSKNLSVGSNIWTLLVTAQNGEQRTYKVNIIRDAAADNTKKSVSDIISGANIHIDGDYITGLSLTSSIDSIATKVNKYDSNATVKVVKENKNAPSNILTTGDTVTISSNGESKNYTVVLYGDINGDGVVNALDLLKVQKHILSINKLSNANLKAADPSKDGIVSALDLLKVQKHILGIAFINQD